jgi:hypothetical protein
MIYRTTNAVKICTGETGDIGDIANFANIVMRFFYNSHALPDKQCLVAANFHSIFRQYGEGFPAPLLP